MQQNNFFRNALLHSVPTTPTDSDSGTVMDDSNISYEREAVHGFTNEGTVFHFKRDFISK